MSNYRSSNALTQFRDIAWRAKSHSEIEAFLNVAPRPPQYARFRQSILFYKGDIGELIHDNFSWWYPVIEEINPDVPCFLIRSEKNARDPDRGSGVISILPSSQGDFHRIVTVSYSSFWNSQVRKLIRKSYPKAVPVFFRQSEIRDSLKILEGKLGKQYRIRVSEVTMKRRREKEEHVQLLKRIETDRLWTDRGVDEVFDRAQANNQWFTTVKFRIEKRKDEMRPFRSIAIGRIYKRGELNYQFLHGHISSYLLPVLEERASSRFRLLSNRGLRERKYIPSLPIQIAYPSDVFAEESEVRRLGDVISKYPNSTKAVYHPNPYYHASIADFLDGSSFDVWVLSLRKVLIVPQAKSSQQAFERLISHIFIEFKEGAVSEYRE
jgi:hypothetical protein